VTEIEVDGGALHVHFGNNANKLIADKIITLQPLVVIGSPASPMSWRCGMRAIPKGMETAGGNQTDIDRKFLPSMCRGD
jgi:type IV pilus assembly protein PilA